MTLIAFRVIRWLTSDDGSIFLSSPAQVTVSEKMMIFFQSRLLQNSCCSHQHLNSEIHFLKTFLTILVFDKSAVHFRNHSLLLIIIHQSGGEWWWTFSEPQHWDEWLFKRIVGRNEKTNKQNNYFCWYIGKQLKIKLLSRDFFPSPARRWIVTSR